MEQHIEVCSRGVLGSNGGAKKPMEVPRSKTPNPRPDESINYQLKEGFVLERLSDISVAEAGVIIICSNGLFLF